MAFFWKKQDNIQAMLQSYFMQCDSCAALFDEAITDYAKGGLSGGFAEAVQRTHEAESAADELRREIELTI